MPKKEHLRYATMFVDLNCGYTASMRAGRQAKGRHLGSKSMESLMSWEILVLRRINIFT
jgi:phosphotransferase system HPr-like phosphotransfer protein